MGTTDPRWHYSGWNIDDVALFASEVPDIAGDFEPDCDVDIDDLIIMMNHWLQSCGDCDGTDMSLNGTVGLEDFAMFAQNWLIN